MYLIPILAKGCDRKHRASWEQIRLLGFLNARIMGSKTKEITDFLPFPWDKEDEVDDGDTEMSDDDFNRLNEIAKKLNGNG